MPRRPSDHGKNATEPVRTAVVGLGTMGSTHAQLLASCREAKLVICCDLDPRREDAAPDGVPFTTDLEEVASEPRLEAVVIATPAETHRDIVERFIESGVAILCEKPIAATLDDADAIVTASERGRVFIGHVLRFDSRYTEIHREVANGALGMPVYVAAWLNSDTAERDYYAPRTTLALELAVHHLDVLRWLAGEIKTVYAEHTTVSVDGRALEAALVCTVRFANGAVGVLEVSWAQPAQRALDSGLSFVGTLGVARASSRGYEVAIGASSASRKAVPTAARDALRREIETFLSSARNSQSWPLQVTDARAALTASLALERSLRQSTPIELTSV
jgi:UDP-N-acetylglucosamine 3-dehydrogenase